ncbi:hypothetical protein FRC08_010591 [Ceratobasidium sp. 394]|nr:hypothetical protein FRC08_010591 [Ceratobasidium sp. 394]KAG9073541.1 hypothetical protein FS749_015026 [Ceratobasidium sp. UAMH 11750]
MSSITPINSLEEFRTIINSGKIIVVDFWAPWCGPCRLMSPVFEKLAKEEALNQGVEYYKVDIEERQDIAGELGVRSIPAFMTFQNGAKVEDILGARPDALVGLVANARTKAASA